MESKIKHLEFTQAIINRMANNSFLLKGWSITIVGGLLAFSFKEIDWRYAAVSLGVIFFFWLLDSYYLFQERLFIKLYDHVRKLKSTRTDFSMDTRPFRRDVHWFKSAFSATIVLFYGGLLVVHIFIFFLA
ncbi:MAG: hypothetical protein U0519_01235 [Candidatus Gracilibacteria bacterium]